MLVNILVCWLSNMPSCGVASRMLFNIMFRNKASNCLAAPLSASGDCWAADVRKAFRLLASTARLSVGFPGLMLLIMSAPRLDDFQLGTQRTCGLHGLQNRQQILRRGTDRIERLDHIGQ